MINTEISENILIQAAKEYGTPCLCYDEEQICYWAKMLREAIPNVANIIYSVKASPNPALIDHYKRAGFWFEVASQGELIHILNLGVDRNKIWVSGQGKTENYLKYAVCEGITHFNLESQNELKILAKLIRNLNLYCCNLRINPNMNRSSSVLQMGGKATPFGIDEEELEDILNGEYGHLINGLFIYAGSQYFDVKDIIENTKYCFELAIKICKMHKVCFKNLDFGGGFGVPEDEDNNELDMMYLREELKKIFTYYLKMPCFSDLIGAFFESGRYLAARTAYLITKIVDVKQSHGVKYVVTDGGINCLGVKQKEYRIFSPIIKHIGNRGEQSAEYCIVGTTCTPIDMTHPKVVLNNPQNGDLICIPDCGAYSVQFSPKNFNGLYDIPEILHDKGKYILTQCVQKEGSPYGPNGCCHIGSGIEVKQLLNNSFPKESDEVQNIDIAIGALHINQGDCMVYDISTSDSYAIIVLKILKRCNITPIAVYSDGKNIEKYTDAPRFSLDEFSTREKFVDSDILVLLVAGDGGCDNNVSQALLQVAEKGFSKFLKVESELIDSMEYEIYDYYTNHINELQKAYNQLADYKSKKCFMEYMRTVLENDFWRVEQNTIRSKYWGYDSFPLMGFYKHITNECLLNIGCCNGDTIFRFLENGYSFSKIIAVDIDKYAISKAQANIQLLNDRDMVDRIEFHQIELGCNQDQIRVDDFLGDMYVTLICMDIEGEELNVIQSAALSIRNLRPVLAISAYHRKADMHLLIEALNGIVSNYVYYLRKYPNYTYHRYNSKEEIVLYAVPVERKM